MGTAASFNMAYRIICFFVQGFCAWLPWQQALRSQPLWWTAIMQICHTHIGPIWTTSYMAPMWSPVALPIWMAHMGPIYAFFDVQMSTFYLKWTNVHYLPPWTLSLLLSLGLSIHVSISSMYPSIISNKVYKFESIFKLASSIHGLLISNFVSFYVYSSDHQLLLEVSVNLYSEKQLKDIWIQFHL